MKIIINTPNKEQKTLNQFLNDEFEIINSSVIESAIKIGSYIELSNDMNLLLPVYNTMKTQSQTLALRLDSHINGETLALERNQEQELLQSDTRTYTREYATTELAVKRMERKEGDLQQMIHLNPQTYIRLKALLALLIIVEIGFNGVSLYHFKWSFIESVLLSLLLSIVYVLYGHVFNWIVAKIQYFLPKKISYILSALPLVGVFLFLAFFRGTSHTGYSMPIMTVFFLLVNITLFLCVTYVIHVWMPSKEQRKLYREWKELTKEIGRKKEKLKSILKLKRNAIISFNVSELSKADKLVLLDNAKYRILTNYDIALTKAKSQIIEMREGQNLPSWVFEESPPLDLNVTKNHKR